jgi:SAM-dependent methyltransferase
MTAATRTDAQLLEANRSFYDPLWSDARLVMPERFNTWPLLGVLAAQAPRRLEVAPGLRPRLPLQGTQFVDASAPAVEKLQRHGASAVRGLVSALPHADGAFDLVCALDIIEHVDDDDDALAELARVAAPGACFVVSVPLHAALWTAFDDFVGHRRRYEPQALAAKLGAHGFIIERSAVYGMQPESTRLLGWGLWFLEHHRTWAMWWYNHVFFPLGLRAQKSLHLVDGLVVPARADELILVCRKSGALH